MPKQYKGSFNSVIDLALLASENDGKLPTEIQVLPVGEWLTLPYGPMTIDEAVISQMVANFKVRKKVPVDVDHDGGRAAGWITELIDKASEGLWAMVKWTRYGKDLLSNEEYTLFSPEWSFDYVDPEKSTHHGAVLIAGSLTNRPLFKELKALVANDGSKGDNGNQLTDKNKIVILINSEENSNMNIKDILAKKPADRTEDEVKALSEATDLTDDQKAQLDTEKSEADAAAQAQADADKAKAEAEAQAAKDKELAENEAQTAAEKGDKEMCIAALQKTGMTADEAGAKADTMIAEEKAKKENVTISASELAKYKALEKEATKRAAEDSVAKYFKADDGKVNLTAAVKDELVNLVLTCNDAQKASLLKILDNLPKVQIAGEQGDQGDATKTAYDQLKAKVDEAMTADDKLSRAQAWSKVREANPELAKQADEA